MSRAFVKEQDTEAVEELPDRRASEHSRHHHDAKDIFVRLYPTQDVLTGLSHKLIRVVREIRQGS
jgi:hypothetical protein